MRAVKTDKPSLQASHSATYAGRYFSEPVPKHEIPARSMPAAAAYQLVRDELNLDGNPLLNLASFVTSWMEPEADRLAAQTLGKNFIDHDEYPQTEVVHERVIAMLADLFNAPDDCAPVGTATIGSSEAIMLALIAHRRSWRRRREARGEPFDRPNLVMGADVHTCWEKFTRYFEVEPRVVPMSPDRLTLSASDVEAHIDENTIAVAAVLGTTFTGQTDDIAAIDRLLEETARTKGWEIPIHVDAASGGFIAPFVHPQLEWDFRLGRVRSINVSNHKFGLVYPGMGSVVFRDRSDLPEELVFHINYLGGDMPNYSLNFSRGSAMVVLQYYNFLRLGREGYERIMANVMANAGYLEQRLLESGSFELLSDSRLLPVVVVRPTGDAGFTVFELSERLRERGWIVPAYTLPPDAQEIAVLRMVVKENFSRDMAEMLSDDIEAAIAQLTGAGASAARRHPHPIC